MDSLVDEHLPTLTYFWFEGTSTARHQQIQQQLETVLLLLQQATVSVDTSTTQFF